MSGSEGGHGKPTAATPHGAHDLPYLDPAREVLVLFGGEDGSGIPLADTWEYEAGVWSERGPAPAPAARIGHRMIYLPLRRAVVLFGGLDPAGLALADTWEYGYLDAWAVELCQGGVDEDDDGLVVRGPGLRGLGLRHGDLLGRDLPVGDPGGAPGAAIASLDEDLERGARGGVGRRYAHRYLDRAARLAGRADAPGTTSNGRVFFPEGPQGARIARSIRSTRLPYPDLLGSRYRATRYG
jgi:hypothetical protein